MAAQQELPKITPGSLPLHTLPWSSAGHAIILLHLPDRHTSGAESSFQGRQADKVGRTEHKLVLTLSPLTQMERKTIPWITVLTFYDMVFFLQGLPSQVQNREYFVPEFSSNVGDIWQSLSCLMLSPTDKRQPTFCSSTWAAAAWKTPFEKFSVRHSTKKQESRESVCDSKTQCDTTDDDSKGKTEGGKRWKQGSRWRTVRRKENVWLPPKKCWVTFEMLFCTWRYVLLITAKFLVADLL